MWRQAKVVLMSIVGKLLESIIANKIREHLKKV